MFGWLKRRKVQSAEARPNSPLEAANSTQPVLDQESPAVLVQQMIDQGMQLHKAKRNEEALEVFGRILEIDSHNLAALYQIANVHCRDAASTLMPRAWSLPTNAARSFTS